MRSDQVIEELRSHLGPKEVHVIPKDFEAGEHVQLAGGIFHGLTAVYYSGDARQRSRLVLMDFLGRQTAVEVPTTSIVKRISR